MGYLDDLMKKPIVEKNESKKEIEVIDSDEEQGRAFDDTIECPKCEKSGASWWLQQTRAGDEPETKFMKCKHCGHTWRDYS